MADGAYRWLGNAPEPDASRVAEIEGSWSGDEGVHTFAEPARAEPARAEAAARIDRALAAARSGDLPTAAMTRLGDARSRLAGLNPEALEPRRGLAGLFDSRRKRLARFREAWRIAAADLTDAAGDLSERIADSERRSAVFDDVWNEVRDAVTELDAHLAVVGRRIAGAPPPEDETPNPVQLRRETLKVCRAAALQTLPLIRAAQNADSRSAGALQASLAGVTAWHDDSRNALGLEGKRPRKVRPEPARLVQIRDALLTRIDRSIAELTHAGTRRAETESRLAALRAQTRS